MLRTSVPVGPIYRGTRHWLFDSPIAYRKAVPFGMMLLVLGRTDLYTVGVRETYYHIAQ